MKLTTIALAAAFALSSTFALAYTNHHKSGATTHHGTVGMSSAQKNKGSTNNSGQNGSATGATEHPVGGPQGRPNPMDH
jgi:hypothetical protein